MKVTKYKPTGRYQVIVPARLSDTQKIERRFFVKKDDAEAFLRKKRLGISEPDLSEDELAFMQLVKTDYKGDFRKALEDLGQLRRMTASITKPDATLDEAAEAFYYNLKEKGNHRVTLSKYRSTLNRFRQDLGNNLPLIEVTKDLIIKVFLKRFKPGGTRMSQWSNLRAFLNWCVKEKYLSVSPLANEDALDKWEANKEILSVEDFRRILFACTAPRFHRLMPFFVLGGLAGVRRCEMISSTSAGDDPRIEWTDIKWEKNQIRIRQEVAKETRAKDRRRNIPLEPSAREWLQLAGIKDEGPIIAISQSTLQREKAALLDTLGIEVPENALRNSYASYGTACRSPGDVARAMGDLESTVRQYYVDLVDDKATGEAWFDIRPGIENKIVQMAASA